MSRDDDVGKVYVGGVLGLEEADLRKEFEPFGKVRRAWVARNPPGFAFLWFEDPLDAEDACRELNNKEVTPTNRLRVELSKPGAGGNRRTLCHKTKRWISPMGQGGICWSQKKPSRFSGLPLFRAKPSFRRPFKVRRRPSRLGLAPRPRGERPRNRRRRSMFDVSCEKMS